MGSTLRWLKASMRRRLACNHVRINNGGQAVCHYNGGAGLHETLKGLLHQVLAGIVQCASRLNLAPAVSATIAAPSHHCHQHPSKTLFQSFTVPLCATRDIAAIEG